MEKYIIEIKDELAMLSDTIENTVEEINKDGKDLSKADTQDLLTELIRSLNVATNNISKIIQRERYVVT